MTYGMNALNFNLIRVKTNDDEGLIFQDNNGYFLEVKEAIKYIDLLKKTYDTINIDKIIKEKNKRLSLKHDIEINVNTNYYKITKLDNGKLLILQPEFKLKKFRTNIKQDWSFTCGTCNQKVSSKYDEGYYVVQPFTHLEETNFERGCMPACARVIWREKVQNWIHSQEYEDFIEIDGINKNEEVME